MMPVPSPPSPEPGEEESFPPPTADIFRGILILFLDYDSDFILNSLYLEYIGTGCFASESNNFGPK